MKNTTEKILRTRETAKALVVVDKGLLAMDESNGTCNKRFARFGISETPDSRRDYRELLLTTPNLGRYISGVILYDETVRQQTSKGKSFVEAAATAGIIPGIKVDMGTTEMAGFVGEKITEGLDGLRERLKEYAGMGLRFAKWRAVIGIGKEMPSEACIAANMQTVAQYAALCQEAGIMPIVEPEVLMEGDHSMMECYEVTEKVLKTLFAELYKQRVDLEGMILKPNMILAGSDSKEENTVSKIAQATVKCLLQSVPAAVPGVAFLSGGQDGTLATKRLNEMNRILKQNGPWMLTFSFSRAIQLPVLKIWLGKKENIEAAQQELLYQAKCNSEARMGTYDFTLAAERATSVLE